MSSTRFPLTQVSQSLAARFEAQAARHSARVAVQGDGRNLTYDELNGIANGIAAAALDRLGGVPGPVAVLVEHGTLAPAAVLGVLKAGCFCVPLDPGDPERRSAFILADSEARLLLADRLHLEAARALAARTARPVEVCAIEEARPRATANLSVKASPDDLCLVMYTSGSTDTPKGVCQRHRNILHNAMIYTDTAGLGVKDRLSLLHRTGTAAGATALFGALLNGAAILPFDVRRQGLDRLTAWLESEEITVLHAVPTLFRRLTQRLEDGRRLEDIRLIRLGGEAVTLTEWRLFRDHFSERCALLAGLGSSESLSLRQALFTQDLDPGCPVLPVGDAVPDKEIFLVGPGGSPVGPGNAGEIVVRSKYLFPGYWRRPDLSGRVLFTDPHDPGRLVFYTGDLARFAEDGRLFHVGRADSQVKIDGNRVEIAEVEHALREIDLVRDAAVGPRRRGPNQVRLVAFVAADADAAPSRRDLRAGLREKLPEHMVPGTFVFLDEIPLLPGGKIDRRALADGDAGAPAEHVGPRNPIEETLAEIWQRALGCTGVGVHDDLFLDLGGDSLAATQILAEVSDLFRRELPLSALHGATTIAELGARLLDEGWRPPESGLLFVNRGGSRPPLFGICGAFGHVLRLLLVGRALGSEQPFFGLQPPGMDWDAAGCRSIEDMAAHYLREIRRIQQHGPYRLLGTSFGGIVAFEIAVLLQSAGEEVALLAMVDTMPPDCVLPDGIDRAERHDWTDGLATSDPLVQMGVRVAAAHRAALDRHLLCKAFDGVITYFLCAEPAAPGQGGRRRLWSRFATGGQRILPVPGRHGHFHREPQLSAVVAGLRASLASATSCSARPRLLNGSGRVVSSTP